MAYDLIFYGSMAIIFIGIMVASARSRRAGPSGGGGTPVPDRDAIGDSKGGDGN